MMLRPKCQIVSVGKRRDGGTRFWCLKHKADATAKYGLRARHCRYAYVKPPTRAESLSLDLSHYSGGIGIWGAVPPVYDTTHQRVDRGIHVHARRVNEGPKEIDHTYRLVKLLGRNFDKAGFMISELDAIYFMVSSVFGYTTKYIKCKFCKYPHLDKDWFSVHIHRRHLCAGCGNQFPDTERAIGNPIAKIRELFDTSSRKIEASTKIFEFNQADFPGGIQVWGSNPAILWTANRNEEEGIHIHAYNQLGALIHDDTFSRVVIDGISLNPVMVRMFMAQKALPHIGDRIKKMICPKCGNPHFDLGQDAFTPHEIHSCQHCDSVFKSGSRLRLTIGNPMVGVFGMLTQNAPRSPQAHRIDLLPETL